MDEKILKFLVDLDGRFSLKYPHKVQVSSWQKQNIFEGG